MTTRRPYPLMPKKRNVPPCSMSKVEECEQRDKQHQAMVMLYSEYSVKIVKPLCDSTVVEKCTAEFSVTTNYDDIPYFWLKGNLVSRCVVFKFATNVVILVDGKKLKRGKTVEMLEDGVQHTLKLHDCQLSDSSEIKFVSKKAESKAILIVKGEP